MSKEEPAERGLTPQQRRAIAGIRVKYDEKRGLPSDPETLRTASAPIPAGASSATPMQRRAIAGIRLKYNNMRGLPTEEETRRLAKE